MSRRALRHVLVGLGVFACVAGGSARQASPTSPSAQAPSASGPPPAERAANLAGSWEFDDGQSKEDQRNWRRPVGAARPIPSNTGGRGGGFPGSSAGYPGGPGGMMPPMGGGGGGFVPRPSSAAYDTELRRALRDLLEVAAGYEIALKQDQVIITDDLERTLTFSTSGKKEKHRIGATNFESRTSWDGGLLMQDIEAVGGFHMSQVFFPAEDGQSMFVSIRVDKPDFKPPIKPITRTYRRTN